MILLGLAAMAAAVMLWLLRPRPVPAPAPADPHAGEVRAFRRDLYDWLRDG